MSAISISASQLRKAVKRYQFLVISCQLSVVSFLNSLLITEHSALSTQHFKLITHTSLLVTVFLAACAGAPAPTPTPTLVPTLTVSPLPTLQPSPTEEPPTFTPTPFTETPTASPIAVTVEPLLGEGSAPPIDIALPEGWRGAYDTLVLSDVDREVSFVPFAVYSGPVTGGTGVITVLWGFSSVVGGVNPLAAQLGTPMPEPDMWTDGLRLLRLAITEADCNLGTDLRRTYRVGLLSGVGTQFAAVDCPETADTRGWFVGVREQDVPFVFYVYAEPIEAMDAADDELQAILDTIQFRVEDMALTPAP